MLRVYFRTSLAGKAEQQGSRRELRNSKMHIWSLVVMVMVLVAPRACWPTMDVSSSLSESEAALTVLIGAGLRTISPTSASSTNGSLPDIYFTADGGGSVRLHGLLVHTPLLLQPSEVDVDLALQSLQLKASVASVVVTGECGDSYSGNISVLLTSVVVEGAAALYLADDYVLRCRNAVFKFEPKEVSVTLGYGQGQARLPSHGVKWSLLEAFYPELSRRISARLEDMLNEVLARISVDDVFTDRTAAREFAAYSRNFVNSLNSMADLVLSAVRVALVSAQKIRLPDVNQVVPGKSERIVARKGWFQGFTSVRRLRDVSMRKTSEMVATCFMDLPEMSLWYEDASWAGQSGRLVIRVKELLLELVATLGWDECTGSVKSLEFITLTGVTAHIEGKESAELPVDVSTFMAGLLKSVALPAAEGRLKNFIEPALKNMQCAEKR